jgi:hypothetical protein
MSGRHQIPRPESEGLQRTPGQEYTPPKVIHEGKLEVRAGSPLGRIPGTELFDPASPMYKGDDSR